MRIWGVVSQKGGSGKTTLVLHLAVAAASEGLAVSVVDLDPQKSAEQWSELREAKTASEEPAIVHGTAQGLEGMLEAARKTRTDLVLIDTPPAVDKSMIYAAAAADVVIVPTRCAILDRFALRDTLDYLKRVGAMQKTAVILNAPGKDAAARAEALAIASRYGAAMLKTALDENADLSKSLSAGLGVTEGKSKRSKAVATIRDIYRELCEFEKKLTKAKVAV